MSLCRLRNAIPSPNPRVIDSTDGSCDVTDDQSIFLSSAPRLDHSARIDPVELTHRSSAGRAVSDTQPIAFVAAGKNLSPILTFRSSQRAPATCSLCE